MGYLKGYFRKYLTNLFPRLFPKMAADLVRGSGGNLPIIDTATHTTRTVQLMKSCSIRDLKDDIFREFLV